MNKIYYDIFRECFDFLNLSLDDFIKLSDIEHCTIFEEKSGDEVVAFSAIQSNNIRLICVRPAFQLQGYGKKLVLLCEQHIQRNNFDSIILGGEDSHLFIASPIDEREFAECSSRFFEPLGYSSERVCVEMRMDLENYQAHNLTISPEVSLEVYRGDFAALIEAVKEVDVDWAEFFNEDDTFVAAVVKGKPVGFAIVQFDEVSIVSEPNKIAGSIGCVGTIPAFRGTGIGIALVDFATKLLSEHGTNCCFIHETHLEKWYAKLGYQTFLRYWFGQKSI